MKRVLAEFDRNGFVPEKILDIGSGIGSAFWAAFERWGKILNKFILFTILFRRQRQRICID
jgi:ribosomal protein RSM22 (predicted rRNA methylase)